MNKNETLPASLISLDLIGLILTDLNKEVYYKISEFQEISSEPKYLHLQTDGENHRIFFLDDIIWDSYLEKKYENITPEDEMTLNERPAFEKYLRRLMNDKLIIIKNLEL